MQVNIHSEKELNPPKRKLYNGCADPFGQVLHSDPALKITYQRLQRLTAVSCVFNGILRYVIRVSWTCYNRTKKYNYCDQAVCWTMFF